MRARVALHSQGEAFRASEEITYNAETAEPAEKMLGVFRSSTNEHVRRAGFWHRHVRLVAIDTLGAAALEMCPDGHRPAVSAESDGAAELVELPVVRALDVVLLLPG